MELFRETAKGISWVGGFRFTSRLIAYGKLAIIARLLTPELFGVYGIATLVLAFLEIFTETGINTVLIQEKKKIDKYIDTAWIISVIRGIVIAIIIFASIGLLCAAYEHAVIIQVCVLLLKLKELWFRHYIGVLGNEKSYQTDTQLLTK